MSSSADPEGGPGVRTPLRFVRGGVLCRGLMSRRGGPKVVFNLLLTFFFWLASLASIIQTYYTLYFQLQYSVWNGHPFSIFPLSKLLLWKESNFPSLAFTKGHFHIFLVQNYTILQHLRQKISGGGPPDPPHRHIYNIKLPCYLYVSVENRFKLYKKPCLTEDKRVCK